MEGEVSYDCKVVIAFRELLMEDKAMGAPEELLSDIEEKWNYEHAEKCAYCKEAYMKQIDEWLEINE